MICLPPWKARSPLSVVKSGVWASRFGRMRRFWGKQASRRSFSGRVAQAFTVWKSSFASTRSSHAAMPSSSWRAPFAPDPGQAAWCSRAKRGAGLRTRSVARLNWGSGTTPTSQPSVACPHDAHLKNIRPGSNSRSSSCPRSEQSKQKTQCQSVLNKVLMTCQPSCVITTPFALPNGRLTPYLTKANP